MIHRLYRYGKTFGMKALVMAIRSRIVGRLVHNHFHTLTSAKKSQSLDAVHSRRPILTSFTYEYVMNTSPHICFNDSASDITWIIPEFGPSSGGHRTIFRHIENLSRMGIRSTLVILEVSQEFSIRQARANLPLDLNLDGVEIVMAKELKSIDRNVIVTSWHTAYWARKIINDDNCRAFYFIQDNEALFYPSGSLSLLALETYKMPYKHIYASEWLADTLSIYSLDKERRIVDLGVDSDEFPAISSVISARKERILSESKLNMGVYYRPVTARRMEEHCYLLLEYISKNRLNLKLHFFGWNWSKYDWPASSDWHVNYGVVKHSELDELLAELDCCLLLGSTNVSLMPLETISAGLPTFVNLGENNSCLLKDLPIYISSMPDIGFKELEAFIDDRKFLISKIDNGTGCAQNMSWEKQSQEFYRILQNS